MFISLRALVVTLFLVSVSGFSRPFEAVKKTGTIIAATEGGYPPFNLFHGKELGGFEVEIFNALAAAMNLKVEWKSYAFDSLLIGLGQNRYDVVIASHGVTEERAKAVDFTQPHYCGGGAIVAHKGGALKKAALKGKSIAVQVGTTYLTSVQKIPHVKAVKTYPKDTDALQNLLNKRVDNWVTDRFVALEAIKQHKSLVLGQMLFEERVAMAVAKGNPTLVAALNEGLKKIRSNGQYQKISNKYFGNDIGCP